MKTVLSTVRTLVTATALSLLAGMASAAPPGGCERVIQNGQVSNSAPAIWIAECLIGQAGGSAGSSIVNGLPMYNDLGVMGPFGILDGPITGPYHQALFHWQGNNFVIDLNSVGGAGAPLAFLRINGGVLQPLPGSGGGGGFAPSAPNLSLQYNNSGVFGGYVVGSEFAINTGTLGLAAFTGDVAKPTFGSLATTVIGLQGRPLSAAIPMVNQVIGWNGSFWGPITVSGGGTSIPTAPLVSGNGSALGIVALGPNLSISGVFPNQTLNVASGSVPNAAILSGNGSAIGGITLGTNLSLTGSFPNQTLNASGGGTTIPNAALTSGNGSVLGSVTLGSNLSISGSFPTQVLNAAGGGISALTGPVTASGSGSVATTITPTGVTAGSYTVASSGGAFFCEIIAASGQVTSMTSGACGSGCGGAGLTGGGGSITGGGGAITGGGTSCSGGASLTGGGGGLTGGGGSITGG